MHNSIKKNTLKYNPQRRELNLQYFSNPNFHQNFSRIILIGWEMGESSNEKNYQCIWSEIVILQRNSSLYFLWRNKSQTNNKCFKYLYLLLWVGRNISG